MPQSAPVSFHLALYRYWISKRGERKMPARGDIDPAEVLPLLPYLSIVDKVDGKFRYRLVGTPITRQIGYDPTGCFIDCYSSADPDFVEALQDIGERVFATGHPMFTMGEYVPAAQSIHQFSALILPLSEDGQTVNMLLSIRIACFNFDFRASIEWVQGAPLKILMAAEVGDLTDLEKYCEEWETGCRNALPPKARNWLRTHHGVPPA
jgi:hypothetical protein